MKTIWTAAGLAVLLAGFPALAQSVPQTPDQVARPGGKIEGAPQLALVKMAGDSTIRSAWRMRETAAGAFSSSSGWGGSGW